MEFLETNDAKVAFKKLAYRMFLHHPLYLEWAPMKTFSTPAPGTKEKKPETKEKTKEVEAKIEQGICNFL